MAARTGYVVSQATKHWFVDDVEHPYTEVKRFDWVRGYHVGGRSIVWGRQTYRWSPMDFEANARDGVAVDWPIRYKDVEPWYDHVERFIGVSGQAEGLAQLPDSQFLPPMELNCVEMDLKRSIAEKFGRTLTIGRVAHLTAPLRSQSAARDVPVPQPVHSRLSLWRVLQQQFEHAAGGGEDGQHDAAAELDRV